MDLQEIQKYSDKIMELKNGDYKSSKVFIDILEGLNKEDKIITVKFTLATYKNEYGLDEFSDSLDSFLDDYLLDNKKIKSQD